MLNQTVIIWQPRRKIYCNMMVFNDLIQYFWTISFGPNVSI